MNLHRIFKNTLVAGLGVAALLSAGCGYGLVGLTSSLPEDVSAIYVQTLGNRTTRTQVDQILTQALANEFVRRQRFQVVSSAREADAVLSGTVMSFRVSPVAIGLEGRARDFQVQINAQMEFRRTGGDEEVLWKQSSYYFRETYEAEISAEGYFSREDEAIELVADKFAETVVIDILEGF